MNSILVSQAFVRQLLNSPGFFQAFPEFAALQPLVAVVQLPERRCRRCGGAARAQAERIVGSFINVLQSLAGSRLQQLKARAGAATLQFNGFNRASQTTEVMVL